MITEEWKRKAPRHGRVEWPVEEPPLPAGEVGERVRRQARGVARVRGQGDVEQIVDGRQPQIRILPDLPDPVEPLVIEPADDEQLPAVERAAGRIGRRHRGPEEPRHLRGTGVDDTPLACSREKTPHVAGRQEQHVVGVGAELARPIGRVAILPRTLDDLEIADAGRGAGRGQERRRGTGEVPSQQLGGCSQPAAEFRQPSAVADAPGELAEHLRDHAHHDDRGRRGHEHLDERHALPPEERRMNTLAAAGAGGPEKKDAVAGGGDH